MLGRVRVPGANVAGLELFKLLLRAEFVSLLGLRIRFLVPLDKLRTHHVLGMLDV